jgi:hypothetical protein
LDLSVPVDPCVGRIWSKRTGRYGFGFDASAGGTIFSVATFSDDAPTITPKNPEPAPSASNHRRVFKKDRLGPEGCLV